MVSLDGLVAAVGEFLSWVRDRMVATVALLPCTGTRLTDKVPDDRQPVAYHGICDLKYIASGAKGRRVKLLELGSSGTSKFTGAGRIIPESFKQAYRLVKPINRAVLVDNKKVTHDMFVNGGFKHLRPKQVCFERSYRKDLTDDIMQELNVQDGEEIVLKLVNRSRGAGVLVVRAGADLDAMLRILLKPPLDLLSGDLGERIIKSFQSDPNSIQEQQLHWWSNECPVFVAESCVKSTPTSKDKQFFDGTMRIGFVLIRSGGATQFTTEFLGGYWKLPHDPIGSKDLRARCVSKAKSSTLEVEHEILQCVHDELRDVLPAVFSENALRRLQQSYKNEKNEAHSIHPLIYAFMMCRQAVETLKAKRERERFLSSVDSFFIEGRDQLLRANREDQWHSISQMEWPWRYAGSYLERQRGTAAALCEKWDVAAGHWRQAISYHPYNAHALCCLGMNYQRSSEWKRAKQFFVDSMFVDPEIKSAYINLSFVTLKLEQWDEVTSVSEHCLLRHADAFQCSYNLALGLAWKLRSLLHTVCQVSRAPSIEERKPELALQTAKRCIQRLEEAKAKKGKSGGWDWCEGDQSLLDWMHQFVRPDQFVDTCQDDLIPQWCATLVLSLSKVLVEREGWTYDIFTG